LNNRYVILEQRFSTCVTTRAMLDEDTWRCFWRRKWFRKYSQMWKKEFSLLSLHLQMSTNCIICDTFQA